MSSGVVPASPRRRSFGSLLLIGQHWERRSRSRDRQVVRVTMPHRADRAVDVVDVRTGERFQLTFNELRNRWRLRGET